MNRLRGKWDKAANGYDVYEFFEGQAYLTPQLALLLEQRFGLTPAARPIVCLDGDTLIQYEHFSLNWDNWSGLYLLADSQEGEQVLHEVAAVVESLVNNLADLADDDEKRGEMQEKMEALIRDSLDRIGNSGPGTKALIRKKDSARSVVTQDRLQKQSPPTSA